jgi:hypothetical protein
MVARHTLKPIYNFIISLSLFLCFYVQTYSQTTITDSTKKSSPVLKHPIHKSFFDTANNRFVYRNQYAPFSRKALRGSLFIFAIEASSVAVLFATPESFSKWDRSKILNFRQHYIETFTMPPVYDRDYWYINYIGHPYQGSYTYNAVRSQGANVMQSSLFTIGHSFLWEYILEGGAERPSIQDLVTTPIGGIILGEATHLMTTRMSINGFNWYEKAIVIILNPVYVFNNGFKFAKNRNLIKSF